MDKMTVLRKKVEELYKSPGGDKWIVWAYDNHVLFVAKMTEEIAKKQGANVDLAVAGALCHDIADAVMERSRPEHEEESLKIATRLLQESGFSDADTRFVIEEIIRPHSCKQLMPTVLEGKVMATADGAAHFLTEFYLHFCWQHLGAKDLESFKKWVLGKIEKDYTKKLFFDDVKQQVKPYYEALKTLFSL